MGFACESYPSRICPQGFLSVLTISFLLLLAAPGSAQTPTPTPGGDCCEEHGGPGCDDIACQSCVCDLDDVCCSVTWDVICASEATDDCAASCPCELPGVTPTPGGDCCSPHAGPGCDDAGCESCVCGLDSPCCGDRWDATCASEALDECITSCPCEAPPTETPGPTPTPGGDCCVAHAGVGCDVGGCQSCVCNIDGLCCSLTWDGTCASEAVDECLNSCPCEPPPTETPTPEPTPGGDCCTDHAGPACDETMCRDCVCSVDPVCCSETWDSTCVDQAINECAIDCTCEAAGDCCSAHESAGCDPPLCQACVCNLDPVCCSGAWDPACVEQAALECAARCPCETTSDCCQARDEPGCSDSVCETCVCGFDDACCSVVWDRTCSEEAAVECASTCDCSPPLDACVGDCGNDREVTVNELILGVNIALGNADVSNCPEFDANGDGDVAVNELVQAVNAALNGC